jgi:hypothetical protein
MGAVNYISWDNNLGIWRSTKHLFSFRIVCPKMINKALDIRLTRQSKGRAGRMRFFKVICSFGYVGFGLILHPARPLLLR